MTLTGVTFSSTSRIYSAKPFGPRKMECSLLYTLFPHVSNPTMSKKVALTDNNRALLGEVVSGDLEVERGRALSYAARDVVVGAVAGAEPAAKVAGLADGHTAEMGADA
jgi:hypothetical protein